MARALRSNSTAPNLWPIGNQDNATMADPLAANNNNTLAISWTVNPLSEKFNPGTASGAKIFIEKSKGPASGERIGDTITESKPLFEYLKTKQIAFGPCVTKIPIEFDATGNPTKFGNIIDQYQSIKLEHVQRCAHKRYGTALAWNAPIPASSQNALWIQRDIDPANSDPDKDVFYDRVDGSVVAQALNNTLTPSAINNLDLKRHFFTFADANGHHHQDGPTMLLMILQKVDPSTSVSTENHRKNIEQATMQPFNNVVPDLISYIENQHKAVIENGATYEHDTLRRHAITALKSGPNAEFNKFIGDVERDIESGIGQHALITVDNLFSASERFYNNLVSKKEWTNVDPKDARLLALATEIEHLKNNKQGQGKSSAQGQGSDDTTLFYGVQLWRTKFRGKTITRDGKTWNWCPHHKHPAGHYEGLYYDNHDESGHNEWKQRRNAQTRQGKAKTAAATSAPTAGDAGKKKLTIANELKTAFASNLCVSEEDIEKIIAKVNESSDKQEN